MGTKISGRSVTLKGVIRAIDYKFTVPKILLKELRVDGEAIEKDYAWLPMGKGLKGLTIGDEVVLRAIKTKYLGLDDDKVVTKEGFMCCRLLTRKV